VCDIPALLRVSTVWYYAQSMPRQQAPRFGIGEWYGHSFVSLTPTERRQFAAIAPIQTKSNTPPCPFLSVESPVPCRKKGGICSLRLYEAVGDGSAMPVAGDAGTLRITCPHRFKQEGTIYKLIGEKMLGTSSPRVVAEVRFLRRTENATAEAGSEEVGAEDGASSEDVGNIDNVLVHPEISLLRWCAVEMQAVYFSGEKMGLLFEQIGAFDGPGIPFPDRVRRPDYRSSGPKRLMPQLQIKVPTLRRWGKKMAVVVDTAWFQTNVVGVQTVSDITNCDIVWFLIGFDESTDPATLIIASTQFQTLERAVEGLTGGFPVTQSEFESKILEKLSPPIKRRRSRSEPNLDSDQ
jgi:hypothetical protein